MSKPKDKKHRHRLPAKDKKNISDCKADALISKLMMARLLSRSSFCCLFLTATYENVFARCNYDLASQVYIISLLTRQLPHICGAYQ